jgi:3-oxoacyl-[acyl-carrier-protein] synthase II
MRQRVFVTGLGIISAIGNGTGETLTSLQTLKSGIGLLSQFNSIHSDIPVAEVKYSHDQLIALSQTDSGSSPYTRNTLMALIAAKQAMADSRWDRNDNLHSGAILATTVGGMDFNEQYYQSLLHDDTHKAVIAVLDSADCTEKVAAYAGIRHHVTTISTACSSSANAIMLGSRLIKNNKLDRVLVGGTDSLTRFTLNGFFALEILSPTGCRPFDQHRNGLTMGEGAAVLVLESESAADPQRIICEVTGYANANEAYHATASSADGYGALLAMTRALESAALNPSDISYINAHGTGTEINDLSEGRAIEKLFGTDIPPVSSSKAFTGHTLGAAGAIEAVFSALALKHELLLPGLNFSSPMAELTFQPVIHPKHCPLNHVMSNSFGFGGNNTCLIFSKV